MTQERALSSVPTFQLRHRLALAMEEADVSTEDMATEIGKGVTTVRNYLTGRTSPGRAVLIAWALRCGVPLEWLAYGAEPEDGPRDPAEQAERTGPCIADVVPLRRAA